MLYDLQWQATVTGECMFGTLAHNVQLFLSLIDFFAVLDVSSCWSDIMHYEQVYCMS